MDALNSEESQFIVNSSIPNSFTDGFGSLFIDEESDECFNHSMSIEEELEQFRNQWKSELKINKSIGSEKIENSNEKPSEEDEAKYLFLQGVKAEKNHYLGEAIQYYRRAVQLVPDVEFKIDNSDLCDEFEKENRIRLDSDTSFLSDGMSDYEYDEIEDLVERFSLIQAREGVVCSPEVQTNHSNFADLPPEIINYILRWVVSSHVDVISLESISLVCRGLYICARDEKLWKLICERIWGLNCILMKKYLSWREMYLNRARVRFNGVYISRMSYVREGESSLDLLYKPFHIVEYYRYIRFFPDGQVMHITSSDSPRMTVGLLIKQCRLPGVMYGYFKITGDVITIIFHRRRFEYDKNVYRLKSKRINMEPVEKQKFHAEFHIENAGKRCCSQLRWNKYEIVAKNQISGEEEFISFDLKQATYPPLIFSRVRSYTAFSNELL